jgi:hypothetical protein
MTVILNVKESYQIAMNTRLNTGTIIALHDTIYFHPELRDGITREEADLLIRKYISLIAYLAVRIVGKSMWVK